MTTLYALIEDDMIKEGPKPLPTVYNNISNFHLLPDYKLKMYGWYPANEDVIPVYNSGTQYLEYGAWQFNPTTKEISRTITVIDHDIEKIKEDKKNEIKASYLDALNQGCDITTPNTKLDCDEVSMNRWTTIYSFSDNAVTSVTITDFYGDNHTLTATEFQNAATEVFNHTQSLFNKRLNKITEIKNASTVTEIESIDWDS